MHAIANRGDIKKLQKQVSRKQNAWHQQADALPRLTAVPGSHLPPPARPLPVVRWAELCMATAGTLPDIL
jgi:hypothetical protein